MHDGALQFRTQGLGRPHDVALVPLYRIVDQRFTVYWDVYTPAQGEARQRELAFARRTIDTVDVNDAASESAHGLKSEKATDSHFEGRRTREAQDGWFSYEMNVAANGQTTLICAYPGKQNYPHAFDILVNGQTIATEKLDEYNADDRLDREYAIPEALTRGRKSVMVKLQAHAHDAAGALIEMRTIAR